MRNAPMTHVLDKQILFHSTVLNYPCLEDYFEYFTMEQNEKYVLIQGSVYKQLLHEVYDGTKTISSHR
jgi:hypothetical protein